MFHRNTNMGSRVKQRMLEKLQLNNRCYLYFRSGIKCCKDIIARKWRQTDVKIRTANVVFSENSIFSSINLRHSVDRSRGKRFGNKPKEFSSRLGPRYAFSKRTEKRRRDSRWTSNFLAPDIEARFRSRLERDFAKEPRTDSASSSSNYPRRTKLRSVWKKQFRRASGHRCKQARGVIRAPSFPRPNNRGPTLLTSSFALHGARPFTSCDSTRSFPSSSSCLALAVFPVNDNVVSWTELSFLTRFRFMFPSRGNGIVFLFFFPSNRDTKDGWVQMIPGNRSPTEY